MNAVSSTLTALQASDQAAPAVAAAATPQAGQPVAAQPGAAPAATTAPLLPQGFAQALAAQWPLAQGAAEPAELAAAQAGQVLADPVLQLQAALGAEVGAVQPGEDSEPPAAAADLLDPTGQSALAALLLWPAALPAVAPRPETNEGSGLAAAPSNLPAAGLASLSGALAPALPAVETGSRAASNSPAASGGLTASAGFTLAQTGTALAIHPTLASTADGADAEGQASEVASASLASLSEALGGIATPASGLRSAALGGEAASGADAGLLLKGEPRQWQQPLMQALGDRLQLQIAGRSEQAVIKLSPPMLGQVEIAIRQQAGELQVRLSASHGEVTRQLQQVSETLRQDLVQRHSGEVTVQVSATGRESESRLGAGREGQAQQQQSQQERQDAQSQRQPGRALHEAGSGAETFAADMGLLESSV